ncbi:MAG: GTPase [Pirellulales bacterium]
MSPTHAVVLTPVGRGAVAVISVSGPLAIEAIDSHFIAANGKPLAAQPTGAIRFGHWGNAFGEEVVVCRKEDPSYSSLIAHRSSLVEIHCHGGHAAAAAIMADLATSGCTPVAWQDWLQCSARDPIAAEAQVALADAPTERTAAILLDQYHGALSQAIQNVLGLLDQGNAVQASRVIENLVARAELGRHLTEPWRVVLAGPPNVGKSSLINALLGFARSIVFDQPGTTRDVVTARTAINGWPVELADTAGLRASDDALESAGVELATSAVNQADLVILVSDATRAGDDAIQNLPTAKRLLRVRNKIDLLPDLRLEPHVIDTSALAGIGIDTLLDAITQSLVPHPPEPEMALPFTRRQHEALSHAQTATAANDCPGANGHLQALLAGPVIS